MGLESWLALVIGVFWLVGPPVIMTPVLVEHWRRRRVRPFLPLFPSGFLRGIGITAVHLALAGHLLGLWVLP